MIIANNAAGPAPGLGGADPTVTIPVLSISQADGNALKARAPRRPGQRADVPRHRRRARRRLDNGIVAHEWGHYLHHRLVDCGITAVPRAERRLGRLHRPPHDVARRRQPRRRLRGVDVRRRRPGPERGYFGIRRVPYSTDFTKNALTFKHIADGEPLPAARRRQPGGPNSEVHNAGEVWATHAVGGATSPCRRRARPEPARSSEVRRRMSDYVVAGMKLTPAERHLHRAARRHPRRRDRGAPDHDAADPDEAGRAEPMRWCWPRPSPVAARARARSRRRASRRNLVGVTESFDVSANAVIGDVRRQEGRRSCDGDGVLDAGETATLMITVMNAGPLELLDTAVSVDTALSG